MSTDLVKAQERPSFLVEAVPQGIDGLSDIVRPSFVKIIQQMSDEKLVSEFGIGAVILTPDNKLITPGGVDNGVAFVPLLYFIEWVKMASIKLKNVEDMVAGRTFDPHDPIAVKAKSDKTWAEAHPKYPNDRAYDYRYCENINFIVKFVEADLMDTAPVLITFNRTSYVTGQKLAKLVLSRKASIYGGVYELTTRTREKGEFKPKMFTVDNHSETPWVTDEAMFLELRALHESFAAKLADRLIVPDYDDENVVEAGAGTDTGQYA